MSCKVSKEKKQKQKIQTSLWESLMNFLWIGVSQKVHLLSWGKSVNSHSSINKKMGKIRQAHYFKKSFQEQMFKDM